MNTSQQSLAPASSTIDDTPPDRGPRIVARAWYRSLLAQGFTADQIRTVARELEELAAADPDAGPAAHA